MKTKACVLILLAIALVVFMVAAPVQSGVGKPETVRTHTTYVEQNEVHRVVVGCALYNRPDWNFYDQFVRNSPLYYGSGQFSQAEIDFMRTCHVAGSCVNHYIDLTGQTFVTDTNPQFNAGWHDAFGRLDDVLPGKTELTESTTTEYSESGLEVFVDEYTTVTENNVTYQITDLYCESPLVLDLDSSNRIDTAKNLWKPHLPQFNKSYAKFFDITGDGQTEYCEWISPNPKDALLIMPENGKVENALQLFGTAGGYTDGYEKLAIVCDKDNNGWVEGEELNGLMLWIDENNDALCQTSEMKQLSDYNIAKLATNHKDFVSTYATTDGATHTMWDWWPTMMTTRKFRN